MHKFLKNVSLLLAAVSMVTVLTACSDPPTYIHSPEQTSGTSGSNGSLPSASEKGPTNENSSASAISKSPAESPSVSPAGSPSESRAPSEPEDPTPWILHETEDAGLAYQNELIFLGDSTTAHMVTYKALPDGENTKQVWMGAEAKTITFAYVETVKILYPETGEKLTIKEAAEKGKPKYLVITLGVTGGVSLKLPEDGFKKLYRYVLDTVLEASPETQIIVQSIYPVNKENSYASKNITNDRIKVYNQYILDLVQEYYKAGKSVHYADTYSALLDAEGYLPKEFGNGDGLHICAEGYAAILKYLRTHALTLQ